MHLAKSQAFITYYYQLFEANRPALATLYQDASMLSFEGQKVMGAQQIMTKMSSLAFGACKVLISSKDFQPSVSGGIMVFVTGNIMVGACSPKRLIHAGSIRRSTALIFYTV